MAPSSGCANEIMMARKHFLRLFKHLFSKHKDSVEVFMRANMFSHLKTTPLLSLLLCSNFLMPPNVYFLQRFLKFLIFLLAQLRLGLSQSVGVSECRAFKVENNPFRFQGIFTSDIIGFKEGTRTPSPPMFLTSLQTSN